jgi:hypothetical protein
VHHQCTDRIFLCLERVETREKRGLQTIVEVSPAIIALGMPSALLMGQVTGSRG